MQDRKSLFVVAHNVTHALRPLMTTATCSLADLPWPTLPRLHIFPYLATVKLAMTTEDLGELFPVFNLAHVTLASSTAIVELSLEHFEAFHAGFPNAAQLPHVIHGIRAVSFKMLSTGRAAEIVEVVNNCRNLKSLSVSALIPKISVTLQHLANPTITKVILHRVRTKHADLPALRDCVIYNDIQENVDIVGDHVQKLDLRAKWIRVAGNLPSSLTHLSLHSGTRRLPGKLSLGNLPLLQELRLVNLQICFAQPLRPFTETPSLTKVAMEECSINTQPRTLQLAVHNHSRLKRLDFIHSSLDDDLYEEWRLIAEEGEGASWFDPEMNEVEVTINLPD